MVLKSLTVILILLSSVVAEAQVAHFAELRTTPGLKLSILDFGIDTSSQHMKRRGTAFCVGKSVSGDLIFVTCGHCVTGSNSSVAVFINGWRPGRVIALDQSDEVDIAILSVPYAGYYPAYEVTDQSATIGTKVSMMGAGGKGLRSTRGIVHDGHISVTGDRIRSGDSGGPWVTADGRLVGVCRDYKQKQDVRTGKIVKEFPWFCGYTDAAILSSMLDQSVKLIGSPDPVEVNDSLPNSVLFFTAAWCGPCKTVKPLVERSKKAGQPLQVIDVDQNEDLCRKHKVTQIPSFVLILDGKEADRFTYNTRQRQTSDSRVAGMVQRAIDANHKPEKTPVEITTPEKKPPDIENKTEAPESNGKGTAGPVSGAGKNDATAGANDKPKATDQPIQKNIKSRLKAKAISTVKHKAIDAGLSLFGISLETYAAAAGLGAATGGTGWVAWLGLNAARIAWRKRKNRKLKKQFDTAAEEIFVSQKPTPKQPTPEPTSMSVEELTGLVNDVVELRDAEQSEIEDRVAKELEGAVVRTVLKSDGKTTEDQIWKEGVRRLASGHPSIACLGGKEAGRATQRWAYEVLAKRNQQHLAQN